MQRKKQLALGAFSIALATTGLAYAGGNQQQDPAARNQQTSDSNQQGSSQQGSSQQGSSQQGSSQQGGRNAQPAPQTGSAAPTDPTLQRSTSNAAMNPASMSPAAGANRAQVQQMQRELAQRGLYQGAIDGMAGPQTMAALRQFQEQQGLTTSNGFDEATRQALGIQLDRQPVSGAQTSASPELERPVGREGVTPGVTGGRPMRSQVQLETLNQEQLRTLQTRLQELGFYQGQVDGVLGEGTRSSLRQFFQTQADLASRGIITDATVGVFGVSPQGLNGATTGSQRGTQTRGSESRGGATDMGGMSPGMNPSGTSPGMSPGGSSSSSPRNDMRTAPSGSTMSPNGSTTSPNSPTTPAPGGTNAPQGSGTSPR